MQGRRDISQAHYISLKRELEIEVFPDAEKRLCCKLPAEIAVTIHSGSQEGSGGDSLSGIK